MSNEDPRGQDLLAPPSDAGGAAVDQGVIYPSDETGRHATTPVGQQVFAAAASAVDAGLAERIGAVRDWRHGYVLPLRDLVAAAATSAEAGVAEARAGLDCVLSTFRFARAGRDMSIPDALSTYHESRYSTAVIPGRSRLVARRLEIPYEGKRIHGDQLNRVLEDWLRRGVIEPDCAEAVRLVMANPDWLDLSDRAFAVLGAGAEMGPVYSLLHWGATVLAVDLPRRPLWERLVAIAHGATGRLLAPVPVPPPRDPADTWIPRNAGIDLIQEAPEARTWLVEAVGVAGDELGRHLPLTVGTYVYADGAAHARVAIAADAVIADILGRLPDASMAVLATPTDAFAVPLAAVQEADRRWQGRNRVIATAQTPLRLASRGKLFEPQYADTLSRADGRELGIADAMVVQQGPNYTLAKRLQRWRATVSRADSRLASVHVAPPTRTRSVLRNRVLATAYTGSRRFGMEVFAPSTANALMAALLVHDLRNPAAVANPASPMPDPVDLIAAAAAHGGLWRAGYAPRSVLGFAVLLGAVRRG